MLKHNTAAAEARRWKEKEIELNFLFPIYCLLSVKPQTPAPERKHR